MDRKSLTFTAVLAASITTNCIHTTEPPKDVPLNAAQQQTSEQKAKEDAQQGHRGSKMIAEEIFLGLSPNAWIALFTFVLIGVAGMQALIYFLQLRTTHRVERAYVYVNAITSFTAYRPRSRPEITFEVINSGRTPAHILSYGAAMWFRGPTVMHPPMPLEDFHLL